MSDEPSDVDTLLDRYTIEKLTELYLRLRTKKKELAATHSAEMKKLCSAPMDLIERGMAKYMQDNGLTSAPNNNGTPFRKILPTVVITDQLALSDFIKENDLEDWYPKGAKKDAVMQYLEETGEVPPGIAIEQIVKINVRAK